MATKDYPAAFAALREILRKHADGMTVLKDAPNDFTVVTRATLPGGKPLWFGAVLWKKSAVTYHLLPLYCNPAMQTAVPKLLLPRKQGKACFNFQRPDPELFAAIDVLTARGRAGFEQLGLLRPGPVTREQLGSATCDDASARAKPARQRRVTGKPAPAKRAGVAAKHRRSATR